MAVKAGDRSGLNSPACPWLSTVRHRARHFTALGFFPTDLRCDHRLHETICTFPLHQEEGGHSPHGSQTAWEASGTALQGTYRQQLKCNKLIALPNQRFCVICEYYKYVIAIVRKGFPSPAWGMSLRWVSDVGIWRAVTQLVQIKPWMLTSIQTRRPLALDVPVSCCVHILSWQVRWGGHAFSGLLLS